jgi:hypothetical protein
MDRKIGVILPHVSRRIGANAMQISYLCKTHNNQLSEIDQEARKLVMAFRTYLASPPVALCDGGPAFDVVPIDGKKFERWALKTFFNQAIWTGCMPNDVPPGNITGGHILHYVFGKGPRPAECGVFMYDYREKSRDEFDKSLFEVSGHNVKTRIFRQTTRKMSSEFTLPAFLRLKLFGVEIAVCGNITQVGNPDWHKIMKGLKDHPSKHAVLYPPRLDFGGGTASHGADHYTKLALEFNWGRE